MPHEQSNDSKDIITIVLGNSNTERCQPLLRKNPGESFLNYERTHRRGGCAIQPANNMFNKVSRPCEVRLLFPVDMPCTVSVDIHGISFIYILPHSKVDEIVHHLIQPSSRMCT